MQSPIEPQGDHTPKACTMRVQQVIPCLAITGGGTANLFAQGRFVEWRLCHRKIIAHTAGSGQVCREKNTEVEPSPDTGRNIPIAPPASFVIPITGRRASTTRD